MLAIYKISQLDKNKIEDNNPNGRLKENESHAHENLMYKLK